MKKSFFIAFIFFFTASPKIYTQISEPDTINIYLVKESWHTGIMIPVNNYTTNKIPAIEYFKEYLFVDIGWGDADFYQTPGFDLFLAAKAILIPTPSVIRIDGYKYPIDTVILWREFAIKFKLSGQQFNSIADYINCSFKYDSEGHIIVSKTEKEKQIIFFKANYHYYFLRTCNTWAAEVINQAGYNVDLFGLVTAGQLYSKFARFGEILKKY